jgi:hypothetical protein
MVIDKKRIFVLSQPQKMTRFDICGRSPGLTSSYFAPSRFSSGRSHFVRITVAGTAQDLTLDSLLCYKLAPSCLFDYFHYKGCILITQGTFQTSFFI